MKKLDKVILVLYYKNRYREVMIFNNQKSYKNFIDSHIDEINEKDLLSYEIYFGYLASKYEVKNEY